MAQKLFEYHPVIGYRFIPAQSALVPHEVGPYVVRCNRVGFRCDREATEHSPEGTFRVVVFGDSYTAGDGICNDRRYTDLLEQRLPRCEVLNFGLPGSGTDQQYLVFREYVSRISYDLMVLSPMVSNIWRNLSGEHLVMEAASQRVVRRSKPFFRLVNGALHLENQPVPQELHPVDPDAPDDEAGAGVGRLSSLARDLVRSWPELHCLSQRIRGIRSPAEYDDPQSPAWLLMKAILSEWIRRSKVPVLIFPIPTFSHVFKCIAADGYLRRFAELAAEEGAELVDALPEFWRIPAIRRRRCRFPGDDHPTELGHEVLARALHPHVRRHHSRYMDEQTVPPR